MRTEAKDGSIGRLWQQAAAILKATLHDWSWKHALLDDFAPKLVLLCGAGLLTLGLSILGSMSAIQIIVAFLLCLGLIGGSMSMWKAHASSRRKAMRDRVQQVVAWSQEVDPFDPVACIAWTNTAVSLVDLMGYRQALDEEDLFRRIHDGEDVLAMQIGVNVLQNVLARYLSE